MTDSTQAPAMPRLNRLANEDVFAALGAGVADFRKAPAFGLFFGGIFTAAGIVIFLQLAVWQSSYWAVPMAAGFPLLGPFLAVGLYAVSRSLAKGERPDWAAVLAVPVAEGRRQLPWMAFVALFFYFVWVYLAHLIFALSVGLKPLDSIGSLAQLLLTPSGAVMLIIGTAVGGVLAFLLFAVMVIAVPMVIDREIDFVTAMVTSFRSVLENRGPMLTWGAIIAGLSAAAMLPMFLGMLVVFPVLGHASWHLYRKAVAED